LALSGLWWWIDRWRKSTAYTDMTLAEQGAYRNLLDEAHLRGGALPNNERILAKASGDAVGWPEVRAVVMAHFELHADGWHNATLDSVLRESNRRAEKQREYRARQDRGNATGNATGNGGGNEVRPPDPDPDPDLLSGSGRKSSSVLHAAHEPAARPTRKAAAAQPADDDAGGTLRFPVVGGDGAPWRLPPAQVADWARLYPNLDVPGEMRKALAWLIANPKRRKTRGGMPSFLVNWLSRATDQGRDHGHGPAGKTAGNLGNALRFIDRGTS
jgi:uncharacterized protein YdaU (DUF1376 family)